MSRSLQAFMWVPTLAIFSLVCPSLHGQTEGKAESMVVAPVNVELTQHLSPWDARKLATDRFKLSSTVKSFAMTYSNLVPAGFTGGQFQVLPGGYSSSELAWKRPWGTVKGFRTVGCSRCPTDPSAVRKLSGVVMELPKAVFGTYLSTSVLLGVPASTVQTASASGNRSQAHVAASRELKHGFKLVAEWSQSRQPVRQVEKPSGNRGLYAKLGRETAKTAMTVAVRRQGEGLVSPAVVVRGRTSSWFAVDVRRTFKGHEFQYSKQINSHKPVQALRVPSLDVHEESLRYVFSPRWLPQLSAARTWTSQSSNGKRENEQDLRLAMNKGLKRLSLAFSYLRGTRIDEFSFRPLWERTSLSGDASIEFQKERRLTVHYESDELMLRTTAQLLNTESLQFGTRIAYWQDRVSLMPVIHYRHQQDSRGMLDTSLLNLALSALLKMPRYLPMSDLMISVSKGRLSGLSGPNRNSAGLLLQWNLKRL